MLLLLAIRSTKLLNYRLNSDFSLNSNWISFLPSPYNDSGLHPKQLLAVYEHKMTTRQHNAADSIIAIYINNAILIRINPE